MWNKPPGGKLANGAAQGQEFEEVAVLSERHPETKCRSLRAGVAFSLCNHSSPILRRRKPTQRAEVTCWITQLINSFNLA